MVEISSTCDAYVCKHIYSGADWGVEKKIDLHYKTEPEITAGLKELQEASLYARKSGESHLNDADICDYDPAPHFRG